MKGAALLLWVYACPIYLLISHPSLFAAEDDPQGVRKYGVVHNIAEDRLIEKIGGTYEPEGLDKYVKRRFDDLAQQLETLKNDLAALQTAVDEIRQSLKKESEAKKT